MESQLMARSDAAKAKPDGRKERKEAKLLSKSPLRSRRSSSSLSPEKKEKMSSPAGDVCPSEAAKNRAEAPPPQEPSANDECQPAHQGGYSPGQKHFQRTLSPADVLHVHSYAKGDYGEGDAAVKEEKRVEVGHGETDDRSRHLQHHVSRRQQQVLLSPTLSTADRCRTHEVSEQDQRQTCSVHLLFTWDGPRLSKVSNKGNKKLVLEKLGGKMLCNFLF